MGLHLGTSSYFATSPSPSPSPPPLHSRPILQHPKPQKHYYHNTHLATGLPLVPCPESLFLSLQSTMSHLPHQPQPLQQQPSPSLTPIPAPVISRKRSPQIAFADETPPSSRPPSRAHTQRRVRAKRAAERPGWVTEKNESIGLEARMEDVTVDIMWPGTEEIEVGRRVGELRTRRRFTVLCFLGCTLEHLQGLGHVSTLLSNSGADVFGVSLSAPPPFTSSLPIIHDISKSLTLSLGLLHPLGGGRQALDAIVVLDRDSRRRMVLPVGWGPRLSPGQRDEENGDGVSSVVSRCVKGVEWLGNEAVDEAVEDVEMGMGVEMVGVAV